MDKECWFSNLVTQFTDGGVKNSTRSAEIRYVDLHVNIIHFCYFELHFTHATDRDPVTSRAEEQDTFLKLLWHPKYHLPEYSVMKNTLTEIKHLSNLTLGLSIVLGFDYRILCNRGASARERINRVCGKGKGCGGGGGSGGGLNV